MCIHLLFPLPSCPPQSSHLSCSHSLPYLLPSAPVFLSPFSPQDTLILLLHSSLSECQPVFFFPSRPHSSPLLTALSTDTLLTVRTAALLVVFMNVVFSHGILKARFIFGSKVLAEFRNVKQTPFSANFIGKL